jgi:hypothetical protein
MSLLGHRLVLERGVYFLPDGHRAHSSAIAVSTRATINVVNTESFTRTSTIHRARRASISLAKSPAGD